MPNTIEEMDKNRLYKESLHDFDFFSDFLFHDSKYLLYNCYDEIIIRPEMQKLASKIHYHMYLAYKLIDIITNLDVDDKNSNFQTKYNWVKENEKGIFWKDEGSIELNNYDSRKKIPPEQLREFLVIPTIVNDLDKEKKEILPIIQNGKSDEIELYPFMIEKKNDAIAHRITVVVLFKKIMEILSVYISDMDTKHLVDLNKTIRKNTEKVKNNS